ncbi:MAG: hypothetical protein ABSD20_01080 [Terriglobales bacterium]
MNKIAVIAAMEREVTPLIQGPEWKVSQILPAPYRSYESEHAIVVCSGIGAASACQTAVEVAALNPLTIISAGFAGGITSQWHVGDVMFPARIVRSEGGASVDLSCWPEMNGFCRKGVLVSSTGIPGQDAKRLLANLYRADAVDMEAATVAEVADGNGIPFVAVKVICDEYNFPMPDLEPFLGPEGKFLIGRFLLHTALRPRLWSVLRQLASNSKRASQELCRVLQSLLVPGALNLAQGSGLHTLGALPNDLEAGTVSR